MVKGQQMNCILVCNQAYAANNDVPSVPIVIELIVGKIMCKDRAKTEARGHLVAQAALSAQWHGKGAACTVTLT